MKLLDIRTVTGHDNMPMLIADVMLDGALLPVSMPLEDYNALTPMTHTANDFDPTEKEALTNQREHILATFDQEPLSKADADELFHELLEVYDHLSNYQPEYREAQRVADNFNFDNIDEVAL